MSGLDSKFLVNESKFLSNIGQIVWITSSSFIMNNSFVENNFYFPSSGGMIQI